MQVKCPYCGSFAELVNSKKVYGKDYGNIWLCSNYPKCDSYVGVHTRGDKKDQPLERLADFHLRRFRNKAHAAFDPIWRSRKLTRPEAYAWLSKKLGIDSKDCHIAMFGIANCKKVIKLCKKAHNWNKANKIKND